MSLRPAILGLLPRTGHALTRELAASAGASTIEVFRELVKLQSEGVVTHRLGIATIGNVGWCLTPSSESHA